MTRFIDEECIRTVLVVGSTGLPGRNAWENLVELALKDRCDEVVWSGIAIEGARPYVRADGLALPFPDDAFDLVFSNAVIEHVGGAAEQKKFVSEHQRVGRTWALTTPNLWFPVEPHTRAVIRYWSPSWRARQTGFTRLLSRRTLRQLAGTVRGGPLAPTFIAWGS